MRSRLFIIAILSLTLIGLIAAAPARAWQSTTGDAAHGAELYAQNCAACHGATGEGRIGAKLNDVFVSMSPEEQLTEIISDGRPGTFMPAWSEAKGGPLTDQDIQDIIAYIESWGTTYEPPAPLPPEAPLTIPTVEGVTGNPTEGYTVFQQNCATCHGVDGQGRIGKNLSAFTAIDPGPALLETIRDGRAGTLMPAWSQAKGGPLTDEQIENVAAYVMTLRSSPAERPGEQVVPQSWIPFALFGAILLAIVIILGVITTRKQPPTPPIEQKF